MTEIKRDLYLQKLIDRKKTERLRLLPVFADVANHICYLICITITCCKTE